MEEEMFVGDCMFSDGRGVSCTGMPEVYPYRSGFSRTLPTTRYLSAYLDSPKSQAEFAACVVLSP